jgi:hypothetical protein
MFQLIEQQFAGLLSQTPVRLPDRRERRVDALHRQVIVKRDHREIGRDG